MLSFIVIFLFINIYFPFNFHFTIIFSLCHHSLSYNITLRNELLSFVLVEDSKIALYRREYILATKKSTQRAHATGSTNSDSLQTPQLSVVYVLSFRIFLNENQSLDFSDWKHNQEEDLATIHIILSLISCSITTTEFLHQPASLLLL